MGLECQSSFSGYHAEQQLYNLSRSALVHLKYRYYLNRVCSSVEIHDPLCSVQIDFVKFLRFLLPPFHFLKKSFDFACSNWRHWEKGGGERGRGLRQVLCHVLLKCKLTPNVSECTSRRKRIEVFEQRCRPVIALRYEIGRVVWCHCDHRNKKALLRWWHQLIKLALLSSLHCQLRCRSWCNASTHSKTAKQPRRTFF